jgi:hypothetical protein
MQINPPSNVRVALYIFTAVGSPIVAYLAATNVIAPEAVTLWLTEVTVVSTMAGFNVSSK